MRRFLEVVDGEDMAVFWYTLALTGMRRGEVCGLRWRDVDLEAGTARIQHTRLAVGASAQSGRPKTKTSRRMVDLSPKNVAKLAEWCKDGKPVEGKHEARRGVPPEDRRERARALQYQGDARPLLARQPEHEDRGDGSVEDAIFDVG